MTLPFLQRKIKWKLIVFVFEVRVVVSLWQTVAYVTIKDACSPSEATSIFSSVLFARVNKYDRMETWTLSLLRKQYNDGNNPLRYLLTTLWLLYKFPRVSFFFLIFEIQNKNW